MTQMKSPQEVPASGGYADSESSTSLSYQPSASTATAPSAQPADPARARTLVQRQLARAHGGMTASEIAHVTLLRSDVVGRALGYLELQRAVYRRGLLWFDAGKAGAP